MAVTRLISASSLSVAFAANPLPGSPWLWVAGAVGAASLGWWLWKKKVSWTCAAGHECTKFKSGSWHDDDLVARVLKIYDDAPTNVSALTVKREVTEITPSSTGDYTVYELPAGKTLSSQPHPIQSFLP